jgi:hypothetical protein
MSTMTSVKDSNPTCPNGKDRRVFRRGRPARLHTGPDGRDQCFMCQKKLRSILFLCRCDQMYCSSHIQNEVHSCKRMAEVQKTDHDRNTESLYSAKCKNSQIIDI